MRRRLIPGLVAILLILGLAALRIWDPYPVEAARQIALDGYQRLQPRAPGDFPVRVVDIDEASLAELGQWPWPRDRLAELTYRLAELGAAAIVYDILFAEPDRTSPRLLATTLGVDPATLPDNDELFATALSLTPSVLGFSLSTTNLALPGPAKAGFAVSGLDPRASIPSLPGSVLPLPMLTEAAPGLGAISLNAGDSISTVRRLPLVWRSGDNLQPTLSIESLRIALGIGAIVVLGETSTEGYVEGLRIGDFDVPTTPQGDLWLYYRLPDPALYVSARDVLGADPQSTASRIAGHIVLIGTSASGLGDLRGTPLGDTVPGVSIHAQAIEQIISGTYLYRDDWVEALEIVALIVLSLFVAGSVLSFGPLVALLTGAIFSAVAIGFSWWMFSVHTTLVDPAFTVLGGFVVYTAMTFVRFLTADRNRRQIRRAFSQYVAPEILEEIERKGGTLQLGGEVRPLSVMFADIRGFTSISETMSPARLVHMLNTLFGALGDEIIRERGTIDKFIGDAIMAFWNAPVDIPDHAMRSCVAALGMRKRLRELNADPSKLGIGGGSKTLDIGIGISSGDALVGNLGLESRFDYSCVGDTVNVASRVEGATKPVGYDIVVGGPTRDAALGLAFLEAGSVSLKGKSRPVPIYLLVGDAALATSPAFLELADLHHTAVAALRARPDASLEIDACRRAAEPIDPRLLGFYDHLADRREDFLHEEIETIPSMLPAAAQ